MSNLKKTLTPALVALGLAFTLASAALLVSGFNPITAYRAMWKNFATGDGLITSINIGARYYIAAISVAIALKMRVFNIGTNGQYQIAAMFGAVTGAALNLPAPLHIAITLLVAMASGALWSSIIAILSVTRNVNPVLSGIMLNGIGASLIAYLMQSKWTNFRDPARLEYGSTRQIPVSGRLPVLSYGRQKLPDGTYVGDGKFGINGVFKITDGKRTEITTWSLQSYVLLAVFVGVVFYLLVYRTRFGFDLRASGGNPSAARSSGINPRSMIMITMALSGAIAGLIGIGIVLSSNDQLAYGDRFPGGLGFAGIGIALLGRNHPVGVAAAALFWAALDQGARGLTTVKVPGEIAVILQGSLLFIAVIVYAVSERKALAAFMREAAALTHAARAQGAAS
jgi:general nucleoside transport system permease protein